MRRVEAVIFDFDGLVVDTESPAYAAWLALYAEHGVTLALERWVECVGSSIARFDPVQHLTELTGRTFDREALIADKERRKAEVCNSQPLLPGVLHRLDEIARLGLKVAVASSSGRAWVTGHIARLGLDGRFPVIKTREDVARIKPFPDIYLATAKALAVEPRRCLVFEDSANGVRAAKAAEMRCFAVPNPITRGLDFSEADGVLTSLAATSLAALIAEIGGRDV